MLTPLPATRPNNMYGDRRTKLLCARMAAYLKRLSGQNLHTFLSSGSACMLLNCSDMPDQKRTMPCIKLIAWVQNFCLAFHQISSSGTAVDLSSTSSRSAAMKRFLTPEASCLHKKFHQFSIFCTTSWVVKNCGLDQPEVPEWLLMGDKERVM